MTKLEKKTAKRKAKKKAAKKTAEANKRKTTVSKKVKIIDVENMTEFHNWFNETTDLDSEYIIDREVYVMRPADPQEQMDEIFKIMESERKDCDHEVWRERSFTIAIAKETVTPILVVDSIGWEKYTGSLRMKTSDELSKRG